MTTYNIQIDDDQRKLIIAALQLCPTLPTVDADDDRWLLVQVLQAMPTIEASDPGICHGLCL